MKYKVIKAFVHENSKVVGPGEYVTFKSRQFLNECIRLDRVIVIDTDNIQLELALEEPAPTKIVSKKRTRNAV